VPAPNAIFFKFGTGNRKALIFFHNQDASWALADTDAVLVAFLSIYGDKVHRFLPYIDALAERPDLL
jgi:hypothetical protein